MLSPDPKYLYCGPSHKEALSQMIYAVTQDSGFMILTGEVGTGKTTLINSLLQNLPEGYISARIHYTVVTPKGLIQNICKEFGIAFTGRTMAELIFRLQDFLKRRYDFGKKSVLILDEAQNLSWEAFEVIRLLSNVEAMHEKFFQILMVGQPELEAKLRRKDLRQLRERIGLKFRLSTLNREETGDYIGHRLAVAGSRNGGNIFTGNAVDRLYSLTEGIPRRINILCDNALLMGYAIHTHLIDERIIERVGFDNRIIDHKEKKEKEVIVEKRAIPIGRYIPDNGKSIPRGTSTSARTKPELMVSVLNETVTRTSATGASVKGDKRSQNKMNLSGMRQFLFEDSPRADKKTRTRTFSFESMLWLLMILIWILCAVLFVIKFGIPFLDNSLA